MMSNPSIPNIPITTGNLTGLGSGAPIVVTGGAKQPQSRKSEKRFHQIEQVRINQEMSIQTCARKLGISVQEARRQERPTTDLTISQLMAWKEVLDVPLAELLGPIDGELDNPIRSRATLVLVMKSAKQIRRDARESNIRVMADNMVDQLCEVMPELENVQAWPEVGQSHEARSLGVTATRRFEPDVERRLTE